MPILLVKRSLVEACDGGFEGDRQAPPCSILFIQQTKRMIGGVQRRYKCAICEGAAKRKAKGAVDDAKTRYFIVHIHRLLGPADD